MCLTARASLGFAIGDDAIGRFSGEVVVVSMRISGFSGASYGESIPVKFFKSPRRAFL